jgi:hypothetical protein
MVPQTTLPHDETNQNVPEQEEDKKHPQPEPA